MREMRCGRAFGCECGLSYSEKEHFMVNIENPPTIAVRELGVILQRVATATAQQSHSTYILAGDPTCNEATLRDLSLAEAARIRCRVAENSSSSAWLLRKLAVDTDATVRAAV